MCKAITEKSNTIDCDVSHEHTDYQRLCIFFIKTMMVSYKAIEAFDIHDN